MNNSFPDSALVIIYFAGAVLASQIVCIISMVLGFNPWIILVPMFGSIVYFAYKLLMVMFKENIDE